MWRAAVLAWALLVPAAAGAQQRDTTRTEPRPADRRPAPGDSARRAGVDTIRTDSLGADTTRAQLVKWLPADSVLSSLLGRPGFNGTR
jgi:hypothetical protein